LSSSRFKPYILSTAAQAGLENEEQRVGAEIVRRALPYSLKLIARNAGTNGSVVVQKVGQKQELSWYIMACLLHASSECECAALRSTSAKA
jgi:chaperonin GroEL (HSP60 family)